MRVLVIHNLHRSGSASGDDQVFKNEVKLLREHGIEVVEYVAKNDQFDEGNVIKKIFCTFGMVWSFKHYREIKKIIKKEKIDVVHVHTFFPLLSPSILYACKKMGVKVVATLHDTRFVCPCATSLRGSTLCNECGDGRYFRMVKHKCFKNSRIKSFIVAIVFKFHRLKKTFYKTIDRYICLNDNQIRLLTEIGFEKNKIIKKYNFVEDCNVESISEKNDMPVLPNEYVVFYGRIGQEKGIEILEKAWDEIEDIPLVVMGGGPLESSFKKWAQNKKNIYYLGYTNHNLCLKIVKNSNFVVFPSIWYEGCSMVEIETMSLGKPIIATDLGFSEEAIINEFNGLKFPLGNIDEFINCIKKLWNNKELQDKMGKNSRNEYLKKYTKESNYEHLVEIYKNLIEEENHG